MEAREQIPLSTLTTLRAGGPARFVITAVSVEEIQEAIAFAKERTLSWRVLGQGSNVLARDTGYEGVIIQPRIMGITMEQEGDVVNVTAGAGESWDMLVKAVGDTGLWGIENLAGIPGTVGAAPVQNIGAYGIELKDAFAYLDALDVRTGDVRRFSKKECAFGYRESRFKHDPNLVILRATFTLLPQGVANAAYKDLAHAKETGADLATPSAVGNAVRAIRARKFPDLSKEGTAGSFFKNPVVTKDTYAKLRSRYPELPQYPAEDGVKIPLAFILDRVLMLRGYRIGKARLFEAQPLVLVLEEDGTANDVEALAHDVEDQVARATGIRIEREVRTLE